MEEEHELLNICPHHRAVYGIRWRTGKSVCTVPAEMAAHKSANAKGSYRVNSHQSAFILEEPRFSFQLDRMSCLVFISCM